jgi:hypothetical protein
MGDEEAMNPLHVKVGIVNEEETEAAMMTSIGHMNDWQHVLHEIQ